MNTIPDFVILPAIAGQLLGWGGFVLDVSGFRRLGSLIILLACWSFLPMAFLHAICDLWLLAGVHFFLFVLTMSMCGPLSLRALVPSMQTEWDRQAVARFRMQREQNCIQEP